MPALVSEEQFEQTQEQLEANKRHARRRTKEPTLLQGMLVCRRCGYAYYRCSTRTTKRKLYYYRCLGSDGWRYEDGVRCASHPVRQDRLDAVVWRELVRLLEDPALLEAELARRLEVGRETDPKRRRPAELQGERERLARGLLIATERDRFLGRVQIEPDHVPELALELLVVGQLQRLNLPTLARSAFGHDPDPLRRGGRTPEHSRRSRVFRGHRARRAESGPPPRFVDCGSYGTSRRGWRSRWSSRIPAMWSGSEVCPEAVVDARSAGAWRPSALNLHEASGVLLVIDAQPNLAARDPAPHATLPVSPCS